MLSYTLKANGSSRLMISSAETSRSTPRRRNHGFSYGSSKSYGADSERSKSGCRGSFGSSNS
jgi:hypothetical protein